MVSSLAILSTVICRLSTTLKNWDVSNSIYGNPRLSAYLRALCDVTWRSPATQLAPSRTRMHDEAEEKLSRSDNLWEKQNNSIINILFNRDRSGKHWYRLYELLKHDSCLLGVHFCYSLIDSFSFPGHCGSLLRTTCLRSSLFLAFCCQLSAQRTHRSFITVAFINWRMDFIDKECGVYR